LENYDGLKLRPLFYSEISSSFMIYEIFNNHKNIAKDFLKNIFGIAADDDISITREKTYPKKGSIDVFLSFKNKGKKTVVLIEVKVHDYLSATANQIRTYYEAAVEELGNNNVYFIYLTQFNRNNISQGSNAIFPNSIKEYEESIKIIPKENIKHISWKEFHSFIKSYKSTLPKEYNHILGLHENWITAKSDEDIKLNIVDVGIRGLHAFFPDMNIDIEKELEFGKIYYKDKRKILTVDLEQCNTLQLDKVFNVIKKFSQSENIDKKLKQVTEDATMQAVKDFLKSLSDQEDNWSLLSFYSNLFNFVNITDYLILYGTGTRGFSIKVSIKRKGIISLCTLWTSKKIDFSVKR
jgi:hypothetical protein